MLASHLNRLQINHPVLDHRSQGFLHQFFELVHLLRWVQFDHQGGAQLQIAVFGGFHRLGEVPNAALPETTARSSKLLVVHSCAKHNHFMTKDETAQVT